jgi:periplasmic divalent cation tolerance protein
MRQVLLAFVSCHCLTLIAASRRRFRYTECGHETPSQEFHPQPNMTDVIQVVTTTPSKELADAIARALIERRLAACVQIAGPITSVYRWQGQIETSSEWTCTIKARAARYAEVEAAIRELHTYDVPEILATPVAAGSAAYLEWLAAEATGDAPPHGGDEPERGQR